MTKITFTFVMLAAALLLTHAASAQSWSTVASTCQPGSDSIGHYAYSDGTFKFGSDGYVGTINTRCQVNNPLDKGVPKWGILGIGCIISADGGSTASATLNRLNRTNGNKQSIATASCHVSNGGWEFVSFTHTFDFSNFAYYVTLKLTRNEANESPMVWYSDLCVQGGC